MVTGSVIGGRGGAPPAPTLIVGVPGPSWKTIKSAPGLTFAWVIASKSDPAPAGFVLMTVKVMNGELGTIIGALDPRRRITRSLKASAFNRIGSTAMGLPSTASVASIGKSAAAA